LNEIIGGKFVKNEIKLIIGICILFVFTSANAIGGDPDYIIGDGDILEISVWRDESLSKKLVVPPDGFISFPLIGDIEVSSMTVAELRENVTIMLREYVPDVTVTVMLAEINSMRAYVIGKVNKPGEFPITMETSVLQILSMAGGLNPFAKSRKILIIRSDNQNNIKIKFDYEEVEKGKNLEQNILLRRGDVVVVP
jgi:polysaccharide export outer membrane protein